MPRQYKRISSNDHDRTEEDAGTSPSEGGRTRYMKSPSNASVSSAASASSNPANKSIGQLISVKLHALAWILLAVFTIRHTDTVNTILFSATPIRPLLHISIIQITINFILILYLGIYLPKIKGIKDMDSWSVYCPRIIPFMALNGILCMFTLIRSLWPVWGFLTPFIVGIEFVGLLFSMNFVPWC